jgi:predicted dehydrogenase
MTIHLLSNRDNILYRTVSPRIGIIGCGLVGTTHAECLASLGVPAVLYFDSDVSKARALADRFEGIAVASAEELTDSPDVNTVYICTYHDTHAPFAIRAASQGKHLFIEKPMAITMEDSEAIFNAVEQNGVLCMTGFKMRYYPLVQKAKGLIGQPIMLSAQITEQRWPDDSWANDPLKGGGNVLSQGCHAVDMLCTLADSKPTRVYGEARNLAHPSLGIIDTLTATISFDSGAIASLTVGDVGVTPHTDKLSFQAMDGAKTVHLHDRLKKLTYYDGESSHVYSVANEDGFERENEEFLAALREGRLPQSDHRDGYNATAILHAAFEASRTGRAIDLTGRLK